MRAHASVAPAPRLGVVVFAVLAFGIVVLIVLIIRHRGAELGE